MKKINFKKAIIVLVFALSVNYLFSTRFHVTFTLGSIEKQKVEHLIKQLNVKYIDPKFVNEGYLVKHGQTYQVTVVGWDTVKLLSKGFKIVNMSLELY